MKFICYDKKAQQMQHASHWTQKLFSLLSKLANRAKYFACVNFFLSFLF